MAQAPIKHTAATGDDGTDIVSTFHPVIAEWFRRRFQAPTDAQAAGWPEIQSGRDVLIAAPTGSGKTLAAFLCGIDALVKQAAAGELPSTTEIVYVSPLKALGNDIERNLQGPLAEMREVALEMGYSVTGREVTPPPNPLPAGGEGGQVVEEQEYLAASIRPEPAKGRGVIELEIAQDETSSVNPLSAGGEGAGGGVSPIWPEITVALRTGDTSQKERQAFVRTPRHILITTPESLYLMLTAARARETLRGVRTVIVDEIHALARDKRGSHLALSLARLDHLANQRPARIGLSATQRPVEEIAAFLVGTEHSGYTPPAHPAPVYRHSPANIEVLDLLEVSSPPDPLSLRGEGELLEPSNEPPPVARSYALEGRLSIESRSGQGEVPGSPSPRRERGLGREAPPFFPDCAIVNLGHQRDIELHIELPPSDLEAVAAREQWGDVYDRLAGLIRAHRTTLVFVNTRRLSERVAHNLRERLGEDAVASHHGSLSRDRRLRVEQRLKDGELKALVCTASLELGIDIGSIDLVCQVGSPRSVATFLQRVGRSGHALGLKPQGRLFPTSRDELIECAALIRAVRAGRLDRIIQPVAPLDILAQQIVAETACEDWPVDDLYALVRRAWPFRDLAREDFDDIVEMLAEGVGEGAGRAPPQVHYDRINGVLRGRRGARMTAILNGGAIPELADYRVVAEPDDTMVGTVGEDWAIESMAGDIFLLGTTSWRIKRVAAGEVRVENAHGAPPTIPFWVGEAPGRTLELSQEVGRLRRDVIDGFDDLESLTAMLKDECGLEDLGAVQIVEYLRATRDALGLVPTDTDVVFERFFDESGGMQLVVHAPFGARINKAWGLTLRKRFCVRFDFELQAAASDDSIVLSLGPQHSFPLQESFSYVTSRNAEASLKQAILYAPVFPVRWRWDAGRALAVPRFTGARKVPPQIQRMRADDLLAAVFPAQVGCQENVTGPLEIPDHPLVHQAVLDCMNEAMDVGGLIDVLSRIEAGDVRLHAVDTLEPSPMAHEILSGKPYTYLDDAPLEERRTRAVTLRRALPESARELGSLDPDAIARVREEAWPQPRDAEEAHDALLSLVVVPAHEVAAWAPLLEELVDGGRAATVRVPSSPPDPLSPSTGLRTGLRGEAEEALRDSLPNTRGSTGSPRTVSGVARPEALEGRQALELDTAQDETPSRPPSPRTPVLSPVEGERGLGGEDPIVLYFAAENLNLVRYLYPDGRIEPAIQPPEAALYKVEDRDEARSRMLRGWSEAAGPILPSQLGPRLALRGVDAERGLQQLEGLGHVLRGRFTPSSAGASGPERIPSSAGASGPERIPTSASEDEYCDRRLLARIHRYTLDRLRREIDPVSAQDFMRFLLQWQHLAPGSKLAGKQGVRQAIARLEGFEAPAGAWEHELLSSRLTDYRPSWLDELCLAGDVAWARLTPRKASLTGTANAGRATPVSVVLRGDLPGLLAAVRGAEGHPQGPKTGAAAEILDLLRSRGALFFDEIVNGTRRLRSDVERGLRELVAWGLVTADGFQGLRQLTGKSGSGRPSRASGRTSSYSAGGFFSGAGPAGRWALIHPPELDPGATDEFAESVARLLLQRYGVLFRDLYLRESFTVPWRDVLRALRRLEARGIVRGGRFVSGPSGEQYALPEAVDALRRVRRTERAGERVWVSAIDPLNLAGVILPGDKQPAQAGKGTLYIDGLPQAPDAAEVAYRVKTPVPSRLTPRLSVHARN